MIVKKLRAIAVALVVGTAAAATVGTLTITPAYAAGIRPAVGDPLKAAISAANDGNYSEAMAKVKEAQSVGGLSPEEQKTIAKVKEFIAVKSGGTVGGLMNATVAKARLANDWHARKYRDVINDADLLRKYGALDGQTQEVIAQAYYMSGDYQGCARYVRDNGLSGKDMLELEMRCGYEAHDSATERAALEELVVTTKSPEYWNQLLKLSQDSPHLSDEESLDIYKVRYLLGMMNSPEDYFTLATYDILYGLGDDAVAVVQKGMQAKVLNDSRSQRLLATAKKTQADEHAGLAAFEKEAHGAPNGDKLVKLGLQYAGMGRYDDAVNAIEQGLKKGLTSADDGEIALGQALLGAGRKDDALRAFSKAKQTPNGKMIGTLWSIYARTH